MAHNGVVAAGGRLTDWISLGVLASSVPRDAVDEAVMAAGKGARRSDGKLPPHVMVYFAMALALFAEEDYEEVAARLTETLASWGCWDDSWSTPTSGGITQARQRLGPEPLELLFDRVAGPVAGELTRGAFLRHWRLMAIDGFELDVPDTAANAAAFGYPAGAREHPAFPKVRVVTIGECGSHAKVAAQMGPVGGKGASEQALARRMFGRLEEDWLLIADRGFYNWRDWQAAAAAGAALLWRVKADLRLPVLDLLPDGSYLSLVAKPTLHDKAQNKLIAAARAGEHLDPGQVMRVRVIEYEIPDRDGDGTGELIALIHDHHRPRRRLRPGTRRGLLPAVGGGDKQAAVLSYPRLVGMFVGSFLGIDACFLILQPGAAGCGVRVAPGAAPAGVRPRRGRPARRSAWRLDAGTRWPSRGGPRSRG